MRYGDGKAVKLYHTISEVVEATGVPAHVLRYWEQEFPMLHPRKNRAGNRIYRDRDIETVKRIQHLLQVEKFTVEGALRRLREAGVVEPGPGEGDELVAPDPESPPMETASASRPDPLPGTDLHDLTSQSPSLAIDDRRRLLSELKAIQDILRAN